MTGGGASGPRAADDAGPGSGEGIHVASGSFRVSRAEAIEKLRRFQLAEPARFILPWVRAAVAGGAGSVAVEAAGGALSVRFDGAALPAEVVADPLAGLVGGTSAGGEAARHLAVGFLAAWRHEPAAVEVESGEGPARRRSRASSASDALLEPPAEAGPGTLLRVSWPAAPGALDAFLRAVREGCSLCPAAVTVLGAPAAGPPAGAKLLTVRGRSAWLARRPAAAPAGPVRVSILGAQACAVEAGGRFALVDAAVDDDALALDASQASVVRGPRLDDLLEGLADAADRFIIGELAAHKAAFRDLASRLSGDAATRREWADAMDRGAGGPLAEAARRLLWLREAALARPLSEAERRREPVSKRLAKAAVMLSARRNPLSISRLRRSARRLGHAACSRLALEDAEPPADAAWLLCRADLSFLRRAAGAFAPRDVTPSRLGRWARRLRRRLANVFGGSPAPASRR